MPCAKKESMESLPSMAPSMSMIIPPDSSLRKQGPRRIIFSCGRSSCQPATFSVFNICIRRRRETRCRSCSGGTAGDNGDDLERALNMDGRIPSSSDEFVRQVSSRAYHMRRHLEQSINCSSYDVLEANPWREASKPVYVLTQRENQLCTMKTRRSRSEVEKELGLLFSKGGTWRPHIGNKQSRSGTRFHMLVEDIREGVLMLVLRLFPPLLYAFAHTGILLINGQVFEDEQDAVRYCDLLEGGGQGCEGVAELEATSVFDICHKMRAFAVLFRRGRTPPLPESLKLNLRARKHSLEDQEDLI